MTPARPVQDSFENTPDVSPAAADVSPEHTCRMEGAPDEVMNSTDLEDLARSAPLRGFSKQEVDFAFAAELIRSRHIGERKLRALLRNWTTFGNLTLQAWLVQTAALPEEILTQVGREAERYLNSLKVHRSWPQWSPTIAGKTSWILERMDPTGRVAKVFGLASIPRTIVAGEQRVFRNRFRLLRKLGQGGLGTVWLAVDLSLNRYVAIKEIGEENKDRAVAIARFRREAEITGRLDHPNIVPLHLLGENEGDHRLFYVMRYVGNQTLHDALREYHDRREAGVEDPLLFHRLVTAFASICQAIAYAHSRNVLHRDLKPHNVALDDFGQVVVLDWGLAKTMGMEDAANFQQTSLCDDVRDALDFTLAGQVLGTPLYMSPEQAAGRIDEIDTLTDVYGLGAILYATLTGYAPHEFSNDSLGAGSQISALLDVIVDRPPPAPRQLNPRINPALEAICLKAISRDRHARYQSAMALAEDLQRWLADEPISALEDPVRKKVQRWNARHPGLSRFLAILATVVLVLGTMWGLQWRQQVQLAESRQLQSSIDECRELKSVLSSEFQTLAENTRFMSIMPPVQGIIDARLERGSDPESVWVPRLQTIYRGLLDVNPSYASVTYWIDNATAPGKPVRVESRGIQRGIVKTDTMAFFGRHLPEIDKLSRGEVYVGIPGRHELQSQEAVLSSGASTDDRDGPVGMCMVAGVRVYDDVTGARVGGVAIECNLEQTLREYLANLPNHIEKLWITSQRGDPLMVFTREAGLQPIDSGSRLPAVDQSIRQFFEADDSPELLVASARQIAVKIPLARNFRDNGFGLIISYAP